MKRADVKSVALVVAGVFVAGLVMNQFRNVGLVNMAINGYDG
jgi:hypothetical protein